jgi:transcriptional repressor NrdR
LRCPYCGNDDTQVKDSRPSEDGSSIRRRRFCPACGNRFTTFERVQLKELVVTKSDGRRVPFDRDKMAKSIRIACRKRPVDDERIERVVNGIQRRLEMETEAEIPSRRIGEMVMEALRGVDEVAYVRFASVYRSFRDISEFMEELKDLLADRSRERKAQRPADKDG